MNELPKLNTLEYIRFANSLSKNFVIALEQQYNKRQSPFQFSLLGNTWYIFRTASATERILKSNYQNYTKDLSRKVMGDTMAEGVLLSEGKRWRRQRKVVTETFQSTHLERQIKFIQETTKSTLIEFKNKNNGTINFCELFAWIAMKVAAKSIIGTTLEEADLAKVNKYLPEYCDLAMLKLKSLTKNHLWIPTPSNIRFKFLKKELMGIVQKIANRYISEKSRQDGIAKSLFEADDYNNNVYSKNEITHQLFTFFAAGHETTANSLSWLIYHLTRNPTKKQIVIDEIRNISCINSLADLSQMPYTECAIKESLRIHPSVPSLARVANEEDEIDGVRIPAGTMVPVLQYLLHRNPDYWPEPLKYKPERFLTKENYTPFSFVPFSAGPRVCIGEKFSYMEMKIILHTMFNLFDFELINTDNISSLANLTLRPSPHILGKLKTY